MSDRGLGEAPGGVPPLTLKANQLEHICASVPSPRPTRCSRGSWRSSCCYHCSFAVLCPLSLLALTPRGASGALSSSL